MSLNECFACVSCLSPREDRRYAACGTFICSTHIISTLGDRLTDITTNGQKMDMRVSSVDI